MNMMSANDFYRLRSKAVTPVSLANLPKRSVANQRKRAKSALTFT